MYSYTALVVAFTLLALTTMFLFTHLAVLLHPVPLKKEQRQTLEAVEALTPQIAEVEGTDLRDLAIKILRQVYDSQYLLENRKALAAVWALSGAKLKLEELKRRLSIEQKTKKYAQKLKADRPATQPSTSVPILGSPDAVSILAGGTGREVKRVETNRVDSTDNVD